MRKPKYKIDIKNYPQNAAKNFSFTKLMIYTVISIVLTVLLIVTTINQHYDKRPLLFCIVVIIIIGAYSILNIIALIKKIKEH